MASDHLKIAALGRPFTLGMLYNAHKDELIPGPTLWDETTLQKNTVETSQRSSEFQITESDSIESKSSLLDIDASLKASCLCGLVEVGGSAKYLNDQKKYQSQSRVTFQYKVTTKFKQLTKTDWKEEDIERSDFLEKSQATHVVTAILYGANAFFVFDSEKIDVASVQDIQGSMNAVIKKIPSFKIEGKVDIKLTEEEKALTNKFTCKFHGDLILNSNPATYKEAVKTYVELPQLMGENEKDAAPLKVWLTPLKNLPKSEVSISRISVGLVRKAEEALEGLRQIERRCNDSLTDRVLDNFPQIEKNLSRFRKLCIDYTSQLQQTMAEKLPAIREGKENESALAKVFEERDNSPFSQEKLSTWLDHKERKVNVIRSCVDLIMEGTKSKIIPNQSVLDREVLAPGLEDTLCFVFTSLDISDPCLNTMTNFFESHKTESTNKDHWYFSDEVVTNMREKAKAFHDLATALKNSSSVSFLVTAKANEKYKGATIYHYNEGKLVTEDFSKPDVPPVETITDKKALMWYACDLSLDPNTTNYSLILSDDDKKVTRGAKQDYPDHPERFESISQVLCREELTGRHYWEVDWGDGCRDDRAVGVTYNQIDRKGNSYLGNTDNSWCLKLKAKKEDLVVLHNAEETSISFPSTGLKQVGVYLDWPAGTLSFYKVSSNTLGHLYTIKHKFTQAFHPGCFIYSKSGSVLFCPVE